MFLSDICYLLLDFSIPFVAYESAPWIVEKANDRKNQNKTKDRKSIMKFDGFTGEKEILSYKLANGVGWLTTHRLIIQQEMHNPRLNIAHAGLSRN
jgi:hypothetical protein